MQQILTYPREKYDEQKLDKELIYKLIREHETESSRLKKLKDYYLGEHDILKHERRKGKPNFKTVCNHAKDIADTATGYFLGSSIKYQNTADADLEKLLLAFDEADIDQVDSDNALNMSIYGRAYEYLYIRENENVVDAVSLEPENTFIVYDDSIEQKVLFAVYYYQIKDATDESISYQAEVLTERLHYHLTLKEDSKGSASIEKASNHKFNSIPVIEYRNNKFAIGDYEQQISLIDAYNSLAGNRVNDKEQAIDSILLIYGAQLADTEEEAHEAMRILREDGLLELPSEAKAEFLINTLDENAVEVLRNAIKEDIYTFSHIPNLTDENFAGNSSGVAMEFKLLGLEMVTKTKEQYYRRGLRKRIELFAEYSNMEQIAKNAKSIVPQFSRGLPKNILELSQIISNLNGKVSLRQLISLLPFVEDPDAEIEALEKEREEQEPAFSQNLPYEEELEDEESGLLEEAQSSANGSRDGQGRARRKDVR